MRQIASILWRPEGAQIIEFAVTLPLLMVFVVGIGDFGGAITLKHKLNNAVREGARFGANEPTADLYNGAAPAPSVDNVVRLVGKYLLAASVNDCGLASGSWNPPSQTPPLAWTYTATTCNLMVTVDRGFPVQAGTAGGPSKWLISTQVKVSYPYIWQFNRVIGLIAPGANYAGPAQLTSDATVPNLM